MNEETAAEYARQTQSKWLTKFLPSKISEKEEIAWIDVIYVAHQMITKANISVQ
jgi:hypothetical protein